MVPIAAAITKPLLTDALPGTKIFGAGDEESDENPFDEQAKIDREEQSELPPIIPHLPLALDNQDEAFVKTFQHYVEKYIVPRVPGVAVAIISDGKLKVLQGYGVRKVTGRDAITVDTVFRLASVSKTFAGTAAALLVEDGKVTWDSNITTLLPSVEFSNSRYGSLLTLKDIMSQSTGLPTHTNTNFIEANLGYKEAVNRLKLVKFVCPPSKCYAYQNITYSLVGDIIKLTSGISYDQYVQEKIFTPLDMHSASFGLNGLKKTNNFAQPHIAKKRGKWVSTEIDEKYYQINPAAGANASIKDMANWVLAQLGHNPKVLTPSILDTVQAKVTRNTATQSHYNTREGVTDTHYGIGWRVFDYRGDKNFIHHGGWVKGFRSEVVFNKELGIGMVFLSNSETIMARDIIFRFIDAYEDVKEARVAAAK